MPLREDLSERAFRLGRPSLEDRVGLEVEVLLWHAAGGQPLGIDGRGGGAAFVGELARDRGWHGPVGRASELRWTAPCGCGVSFEPGGQLEISSPAGRTLSGVLDCVDEVLVPVTEHAAEAGVQLVFAGLDPNWALSESRLELDTERYRRMAGYFDRIGAAGRRMMRQTASLHINVDLGSDPLLRWRVANAIAPLLTAIFANSPLAHGQASGMRSARAWQWRILDPTRTGVVGPGVDPVEEYLRFALAAPAFLLGPEGAPPRPFSEWWQEGATMVEWHRHLTTVFPEVRPRGYLEVRSTDTLPRRWLSVPPLLVSALLYDPAALGEADRRLGFPDQRLLERASVLGVGDVDIRRRAQDFFQLALEAARRQPELVSEDQIRAAESFYARYTERGLDPGTDTETWTNSLTAEAG